MSLTSKNDDKIKNNTVSDQQVTANIIKQLDDANHHLDAKTMADITLVREQVLREAQLQAQQQKVTHKNKLIVAIASFFEQLSPSLLLPTSVAAVALLSVLLTLKHHDAPVAIPVAMMSSEVPSEDLALLEDLEFITWLAEHEQEI